MKTQLFVFSLLVTLCANPVYATINFNSPENLILEVPCTHGTPGYTKIQVPIFKSVETLADLGFNTKMNSWFAGQFPGTWQYQLDSSLSGNLSITKYRPFDDPSCKHGAEIKMEFTGITGLAEGQHFQWVQSFTGGFSEPGRFMSITTPVLDPRINYGTNAPWDYLPFYNNTNENFSIAGGYEFYDKPSHEVADSAVPHSVVYDFVTLLASWNGTYNATGANVVKVYGALDWGYHGACNVPEPSSLVLIMFAGIAVLICRKR